MIGATFYLIRKRWPAAGSELGDATRQRPRVAPWRVGFSSYAVARPVASCGAWRGPAPHRSRIARCKAFRIAFAVENRRA